MNQMRNFQVTGTYNFLFFWDLKLKVKFIFRSLMAVGAVCVRDQPYHRHSVCKMGLFPLFICL